MNDALLFYRRLGTPDDQDIIFGFKFSLCRSQVDLMKDASFNSLNTYNWGFHIYCVSHTKTFKALLGNIVLIHRKCLDWRLCPTAKCVSTTSTCSTHLTSFT